MIIRALHNLENLLKKASLFNLITCIVLILLVKKIDNLEKRIISRDSTSLEVTNKTHFKNQCDQILDETKTSGYLFRDIRDGCEIKRHSRVLMYSQNWIQEQSKEKECLDYYDDTVASVLERNKVYQKHIGNNYLLYCPVLVNGKVMGCYQYIFHKPVSEEQFNYYSSLVSQLIPLLKITTN